MARARQAPKNRMCAENNDEVFTVAEDSNNTGVKLQRRLGLPSAVGIVIGTIIGSGIFISPKGVTQGAQSIGLSFILWIVGGIICLFGSLSMAEMVTMIPKSGGQFNFLKLVFPSWIAFSYSWMVGLLEKPTTAAILSLTCAEYALVPFYNDGCGSPPRIYVKMLASSILLILVAINIYNVNWVARLQNIFTLAKILALAIIIIGGVVILISGRTEKLTFTFEGSSTNPGQIMLGFYSAMWAYDGWYNLNMCVEELIRPSRTFPLAMFIGMPVIIGLYLLVNASYFTAMTPEELLDSPAVGITWAHQVSPVVVWFMPIFVAISTFGACNGIVLINSRLLMATAREGKQMAVMSLIHITKSVPAPGILFTGLLGLMYIQAGAVTTLLQFAGFGTWAFTSLSMISLLIMRVKFPLRDRPYKNALHYWCNCSCGWLPRIPNICP